MVQINFDATGVAPNAGFEPIPEGWYNVAIRESEMKPTKNGDGAYLQLKAVVIDGPQAEKPVFIRLNLQNQNQQAVNIAYGELSAICHVTGVYRVQDSAQLHNIPFQIKVAVTKGPNGEGNDVKGYRDQMGNEPGKAPQGGAAPNAAWGGAPQGQPAQMQRPPQMQQPQGQPQQPPQGQPWGNQPQQQPQQPAHGGGWGGQPDPNAGQQPQGQPMNQQPQGGAPWGGGQPTQQAAPQQQPQGAGGWQQPQGAPQGNAPWGQQ